MGHWDPLTTDGLEAGHAVILAQWARCPVVVRGTAHADRSDGRGRRRHDPRNRAIQGRRARILALWIPGAGSRASPPRSRSQTDAAGHRTAAHWKLSRGRCRRSTISCSCPSDGSDAARQAAREFWERRRRLLTDDERLKTQHLRSTSGWFPSLRLRRDSPPTIAASGGDASGRSQNYTPRARPATGARAAFRSSLARTARSR